MTVAKLKSLLENAQYEEAVRLCKSRLRENPRWSYYRYWLNRLGDVQNSVWRPKRGLAFKSVDFSDVPYHVDQQIWIDVDEKELLERKKKVVGELPFKSEIYLPTGEISLDEQVMGLERVKRLCDERNRAVSRRRFDKLREALSVLKKKRIFIIGNGPSLNKTDLSLLKNEVTIGFNGIFLHENFSPTIYIVEDHLVAEDRREEIHAFDCPVKVFPCYLGYCISPQSNTIFINHLPRKSFPIDIDFSDDAGSISYTGGTVTYTGLQVAASLGFEEIILVGVDASYRVKNVERSVTYGTGILSSTADDVNHFDGSYFGKGYRWHDPNVEKMLQAYRKARDYADGAGITIRNATIGGELDVFPRLDYYSLFENNRVSPRVGVLDFTHVGQLSATGIVKANLLAEWPACSLLHVHAEQKGKLEAYQKVPNDCYAAEADTATLWPALRSLLEFDAEVLYLRPTHDRMSMLALQCLAVRVLGRPFVAHYMDDWVAKSRERYGEAVGDSLEGILKILFGSAEKVLVISEKMVKHVMDAFGVPEDRVEVIHNYTPDSEPQDKSVSHGDRAWVDTERAKKVVRYFGGLEEDMSLKAVTELARAVELYNQKYGGGSVRLEVYTGKNYIDRYGTMLQGFDGVVVCEKYREYARYFAALRDSDLNVLAYNDDAETERYLRYSMANKLPELLAAGKPILAIGGANIGTISYLLEIGFPHVVSEVHAGRIFGKLSNILSTEETEDEDLEEVYKRLQDEFSERRNRIGFHRVLRQVAQGEGGVMSDAQWSKVAAWLTDLRTWLGASEEEARVVRAAVMLGEDNEVVWGKVRSWVKSHGIQWTIKQHEKEIKAALSRLSRGQPGEEDRALIYSFLIATVGHERYAEWIARGESGLVGVCSDGGGLNKRSSVV